MGDIIIDLALTLTITFAAVVVLGRTVHYLENKRRVNKVAGKVPYANAQFKEDTCNCYYCTCLDEQGVAY